MRVDDTTAPRWQPKRAGIFNIWEYDDHVFEFGDGRLVLRGRNGSGKSNALSLLFPFLLDGVMSAARMDPMGGARSMKSLLLGRSDDSGSGRYRHDSGTGYVWMEFVRSNTATSPDPGGQASHLTIGVGASATAQRDADSWFFVTSERIGHGLELHDGDVPKSRRRLAETMTDGDVFATAHDYRAALDRMLFGLGEARFHILVDLLLTLRRPHLTGKFDIDHLSATLSAGLAELDSGLVDDVAHSFDDLDAMQHELDAMAASLAAVERFLPVYREHLLGVARSRAEDLLTAERSLRRLRRDVATATDELADARNASAAAIASIDQLTAERNRARKRIDTIKTSAAFASIAALAEVEGRAADARRHAEGLEKIAATAESAVARADGHERDAAERHDRAVDELANAIREWSAGMRSTGVDWPTDVTIDADRRFPCDRATAAVAARRDDVLAVVEAVDLALDRAADAERLSQASAVASAELDEARDATTSAAGRADEARTRLGTERRVWARSADELVEAARSVGAMTDPRDATIETVVASVVAPRAAPAEDEAGGPIDERGIVTESDSGEADAVTDRDVMADERLERYLADVAHDLDRVHDRAARRSDDQRAVVESLADERSAVADEPNPGPPANPTRPDATTDRPGAPLYTCVDFADSVDDEDRAGLEAALHAAGLLDARILPDGSPTGALDAALVGADTSGTESAVRLDARPSATLADLLVPVAHADLPAETIRAVLERVSVDSQFVAFAADGTWRLGPLAGRFTQASAGFIGHESRERRRAERLAEIDALLVAERAALAEVEALVEQIDALRASVSEARTTRPSVDELRRLLAAVTRRRTVERDRAERDATALETAEVAAGVAATAAAELQRVAVLHQLPTDRAALDGISQLLAEGGQRIDRIVADEDRCIDLAAQADEARQTATTTRAEAAERRREATEARAVATDETERHARLRDDVGADAQQAHDDLIGAETQLDRIESDLDVQRTAKSDSEALEARLAERVEQLGGHLTSAATKDAEARDRFGSVCTEEVAGVLDIDGVEPGSDRLHAARTLVAETEPTPDDATNRMERAYREVILDGLRAGNDPSMPKLDGFDVIRVATADGEVDIGTLAERLRSDNARLGSLLSNKEREIFETHLLTNIGDAIRRLLLDADEFEQRINAEMSKAPTSSDMVVELAWSVDDEPGLRDAVRLLRRSPDMLGPDDRETLRNFFVRRIADVRADDPGLTFAESLTTALDYRRWHRFDLSARFAGGQRQRMTRKLFSGLSGGERAVVLHLPLFAAASAQYAGGSIAGPRLIALDEAFVGIDDPMRASLMGLLNQLDLDLLVTSHEFWGFYEQVPNLVVYDLVRNPATPGVYAQRFDWSAGG